MKITANRTLHALFAPFFMTILTAIGMDYPQLQLQELNNNSITSINASLQMNCDQNLPQISWLPSSSFFANLISFKNERKPLNNPYANIILTLDNELKEIPAFTPAKYLFNLDDKSVLQFNLHMKNTNYLVTATCKKNSNISTGSFHQQFTAAMRDFYNKPPFIPEAKLRKKFIAAGILTEKHIWNAAEQIAEGSFAITGQTIYSHGKNGLTNEKRFTQFIAAPKLKPYNKSMHESIMNRQTGTKARHYPNPIINLDLLLDNYLIEMEYDETESEKILDACFREFQAIHVLAHVLLKNWTGHLLVALLVKHQLQQHL